MKNYFLLLILAAFIQGCALAIPTHQVNSPQTLGNNVLEASILTGIGATVGPDFEDGTGPALAAEDDFADTNLYFGYRVAYGLTEKLDLEAEALASFFTGSSFSAALKYQWMGKSFYDSSPGDWSSAIRVRYLVADGYEDDADESAGSDTILDDVFMEKLDANGLSAALSFGYHVANPFSVYFGAQAMSYDLEYRYREDNATGTLYQGERSINGFGPFLGLSVFTTGDFFRYKFSAEISYTNMPATYSDERVWYEGIAIGNSFIFNFD